MKTQKLKCGNCIWFESASVEIGAVRPVRDGQCNAIDHHLVTKVFGTKECKKAYSKIKDKS